MSRDRGAAAFGALVQYLGRTTPSLDELIALLETAGMVRLCDALRARLRADDRRRSET
jgi:hypothetical protein